MQPSMIFGFVHLLFIDRHFETASFIHKGERNIVVPFLSYGSQDWKERKKSTIFAFFFILYLLGFYKAELKLEIYLYSVHIHLLAFTFVLGHCSHIRNILTTPSLHRDCYRNLRQKKVHYQNQFPCSLATCTCNCSNQSPCKVCLNACPSRDTVICLFFV